MSTISNLEITKLKDKLDIELSFMGINDLEEKDVNLTKSELEMILQWLSKLKNNSQY